MCLIEQSHQSFSPVCLFSPSTADEFKAFYTRLPQSYFLNVSTIQHLWSMDNTFQWRYEQLETSMRLLSRRAHRVIFKLFSLSKRCHRQPQVRLPAERSVQIPTRKTHRIHLHLPQTLFVVVVACLSAIWFVFLWQRWVGNGAAELFCKMPAAFFSRLFSRAVALFYAELIQLIKPKAQCQLIQECRWK